MHKNTFSMCKNKRDTKKEGVAKRYLPHPRPIYTLIICLTEATRFRWYRPCTIASLPYRPTSPN